MTHIKSCTKVTGAPSFQNILNILILRLKNVSNIINTASGSGIKKK